MALSITHPCIILTAAAAPIAPNFMTTLMMVDSRVSSARKAGKVIPWWMAFLCVPFRTNRLNIIYNLMRPRSLYTFSCPCQSVPVVMYHNWVVGYCVNWTDFRRKIILINGTGYVNIGSFSGHQAPPLFIHLFLYTCGFVLLVSYIIIEMLQTTGHPPLS